MDDAGAPEFSGGLSGVYIASDDGELNAEFGSSVSLDFTPAPPYHGSLIELTANGAEWFDLGEWDETITGGSVDARVMVPTPAAVFLGILGLGVAGWKLRRFA